MRTFFRIWSGSFPGLINSTGISIIGFLDSITLLWRVKLMSGLQKQSLTDEFFSLDSSFLVLENVRTKEIEELSTENMFSLGLGVPCVVWRQCDEWVWKWHSLLHIYLTPLISLISSCPHRRDHEKVFLIYLIFFNTFRYIYSVQNEEFEMGWPGSDCFHLI